MEKKQTAVEFFVENDAIITIAFLEGKITALELAAKKTVLKCKAKQMEKEQIEKAYSDCWENDSLTPEQYYNETYGGQE